MKIKDLLFIVGLFFAASGLQGQEVAEVQQSLITKRTATWCPYCGGWGWDFFDALETNVSDKAVLVAAHFGGSTLENPVSLAWVNNLGGSSQPRFYVDNEMQSVNSGNQATALVVIKDKVDANAAKQPVANVGMQTSWSGADLSVQAKAKFFQSAEGAYYLGIYLVEDKVLANQAGQSGQVEHSRILRGSVTSAEFGDLLAEGSIAAGTEFDKAYTVDLAAYVVDNLDLVGVIWKKEGSLYQAVNVWKIDAKPTVASVAEAKKLPGSAVLQPNPATGGDVFMSLRLDSPQECEIFLYNALGQQAGQIFSGHLPAGEHWLPISSGLLNFPGAYTVRIQTAKGAVLALPLLRQ
jgi:hypothetical protein